MKTIVMLMLASMLMIGAAPAYSAETVHIFWCEEGPDATEEKVEALASNWLKAAKTMKGGERLKAYVYFPVAVNVIGETDLWFVVVAPSFAEWGKFWDGYSGSEAAAEMEKRTHDKIVCPDSALWESIKIK